MPMRAPWGVGNSCGVCLTLGSGACFCGVAWSGRVLDRAWRVGRGVEDVCLALWPAGSSANRRLIMGYVKAMVLSVVVALGCCLGVAASASAEGGPLYGYLENGVAELLKSGKTLTVLAHAVTNQLLGNSAAVIECSSLHLLPGAYLLGGSPGKNFEQILYSGCIVVGFPKCDPLSLNEPLGSIQTLPLESELVFLTKAGAIELNPDESGTLFRPANGVTHFAEITAHELPVENDKECPASLASGAHSLVKGEVILKNDNPLVHSESHELLAPKTAILSYFLGHTGEEKTIKKLEAFGLAAKYLGTSLVDVTLLNSNTSLSFWICP
jgi:hypothetical protein